MYYRSLKDDMVYNCGWTFHAKFLVTTAGNGAVASTFLSAGMAKQLQLSFVPVFILLQNTSSSERSRDKICARADSGIESSSASSTFIPHALNATWISSLDTALFCKFFRLDGYSTQSGIHTYTISAFSEFVQNDKSYQLLRNCTNNFIRLQTNTSKHTGIITRKAITSTKRNFQNIPAVWTPNTFNSPYLSIMRWIAEFLHLFESSLVSKNNSSFSFSSISVFRMSLELTASSVESDALLEPQDSLKSSDS